MKRVFLLLGLIANIIFLKAQEDDFCPVFDDASYVILSPLYYSAVIEKNTVINVFGQRVTIQINGGPTTIVTTSTVTSTVLSPKYAIYSSHCCGPSNVSTATALRLQEHQVVAAA